MAHDDPGREEAIQKAMMLLREHFENVQIFTSHMDGNSTYSRSEGFGNKFARLAQVELWADSQRNEYHFNNDPIMKPDDDDDPDGP